MGLGKSLQALLFGWEQEDARPIVIVCPSAVKYNWKHEAYHHIGMRSCVLEGKKGPRKRQALPIQKIVIINYDILKPWLGYLRRLKPKLVIIDECHYISNRATQRARCVRKLCRKVPYVVALSGTPLTNRPSELWNTLNLLRPDKFDSFFDYAVRYCQPRKRRWGWEYKGAVRLPELHRKLKKICMIRRLKSQVLKDLPPKTRIVVPLELDDRTEYDKALRDFIGWLKTKSRAKAKRAERAARLVQLAYLRRLAGKMKLLNVIDWLDKFLEESKEKIIVFGIHKDLLKRLKNHYGDRALLITGSVKGKKRHQTFIQFAKQKKKRILFGQIKAAGVGTNATCATAVAHIEMSYVPADHLQADDRIYRIGQKKPTFSYWLVARDTIEEDMCKIIQKKQKDISAVLDGGKTVIADDFNIYDQLTEALEKKYVGRRKSA